MKLVLKGGKASEMLCVSGAVYRERAEQQHAVGAVPLRPAPTTVAKATLAVSEAVTRNPSLFTR